MKILFVVALSLFVVLLSGGYYVFWKACRRQKERPWEDPAGLAGTQYAPIADRISHVIRYLEDNGAIDLYITSFDGLRLRSRWLPAQDARGTVLLMHGYRSCGLADFSVAIPFYHSLGFNILLPDQRSHGKSQGRFITFGIREHRDVMSWIRYHNEELKRCPLFLAGMSMGAATVLMAAGRELPKNVRGVIADCGFTSPKEILAEVMRQQKVPVFPLLQIAGLFTRLFAGFGTGEYSTVRAMKTCSVDVMLIHGTEDHFVPWEMSKLAFDACRCEKQLILVEGASHGTACFTDTPRCQKAIGEFLLRSLDN